MMAIKVAGLLFAMTMLWTGVRGDGENELIEKCSAINGVNATLLPNPNDCNTYYVCDWGRPILMKCPKGLHFNNKLKVCDWPWRANCKSKEKSSGRCPPTNGVNATLLPNPKDCKSYYVCDWGKEIFMKCPDDLHFNDKLKVCDWPWRANCKNKNSFNNKCPPTNGVNATLLPNPEDCKTYYVCDWGREILMKCPDGLHFNDELKVCDWPWRANCKEVKPTPKPTQKPTVKPTQKPTVKPTQKPTQKPAIKPKNEPEANPISES